MDDAYRERWHRRLTRLRNERTLRRERAELDARWIYLPERFNPDSRLLPPAGMPVLILGWTEVFAGWLPFAEQPSFRPVQVIRRASWWSSVEAFCPVPGDDAAEGIADRVVAWQPLPADWERWVALTPLPTEERQ